MSDELRKRVLEYLSTHTTMTVATSGPDGPWAAGLFYVNDGFELYWLSDPDTCHSANIARNPSVAVAIHEDYPDWRTIQGIQMAGTARQVGTLAQASGPMALYVAKYPFLGDPLHPPPELAPALAKPRVYHFAPARVYFIDNRKGLGHRDEVALVAQ